MFLKIAFGEMARWYLTRARHPFRDKIIGHYWYVFAKPVYWVRYDKGLIISVNLRDCLQEQIFFKGAYEPDVVEWLKGELGAHDVFWDVGANIGAITLIAATRCKQVVAFEPAPVTMAKLRENVQANTLANVRLEPLALCDRDGETTLNLGPECNSGMNSIATKHSDRPGVPVTTARADSYLATSNAPPPTVMKIDVEGAEASVFAGAKKLLGLRELRALIFESRKGANGLPFDDSLCLALTEAGFKIREFGEDSHLVNDGLKNYLATR